MREYKFRAWDKENKEMIPWERLHIEFEGGFTTIWIPENKAVKKALLDFELMQFTGLYDKNGKEIYEGDLVQVLDYTSWEGLYKVVWDEESLMYVLEDAYGDKEKMCEFEHYLVRGNIYENPELLD